MNFQIHALPASILMRGMRIKLALAIEWAARTRERWRLAIAFGRNSLSVPDAQEIVCLCEPAAGWYPLTTLCIDETVKLALETYDDHPALSRYIAMGCARVNRRYGSDGEELDFARQWAVDEAIAYAKEDGIAFLQKEANGEGEA